MICPICGREFSEPPALSRIDDKTEICSSCGVRESLIAAGFSDEVIEEIIKFLTLKDK